MAVAPVVVDPDRPELAHATRARFVEATSWCIACRRATSARLLRAPLKWLHEPDFCGPCGRPQDEHAAVFFTEAWRALLVRLRQEDQPKPETRGRERRFF